MKCIICNVSMEYFFSKNFSAYALNQVDYWNCPNCNFVISKTHAEMAQADWERLNADYHNTFLGLSTNADDPRWISRLQAQTDVLNDLVELGILHRNRWLDFASGDGKLSGFLREQYQLELLNYDRYMPVGENFLTETSLVPQSFDFVLTTSVFEHIIKRRDLDDIAALVTKTGVMGLHTLVCENIPQDPDWFYLLPVHCAFHTNKSMSLLLQQWGFEASIYNVEARLWLFFRSGGSAVQTIIEQANQRAGSRPAYIFKRGFVDYWK